jgi:hypothetical protein
MKRLISIVLLVFFISSNSFAAYAVAPTIMVGQSCTKSQIGNTKTIGKKNYVCAKNGKSGIWKPMSGGVSSNTSATTTTTTTIPNCLQSGPCIVGSKGPGGGKVFYDAGSTQPWGRFLEVAPTSWMSSQADAIQRGSALKLVIRPWGCSGTNVPTGTAIGTGRSNSIAMSSSCVENNPASLVSTLSINGLNDWFVPSLDELKVLVAQSGIFSPTDSFSNSDLYYGYGYWSSSQASIELTAKYYPQYAWTCPMQPAICAQSPKTLPTVANWGLGVIPVRAFG